MISWPEPIVKKMWRIDVKLVKAGANV